jgi:hypothetical protein
MNSLVYTAGEAQIIVEKFVTTLDGSAESGSVPVTPEPGTDPAFVA